VIRSFWEFEVTDRNRVCRRVILNGDYRPDQRDHGNASVMIIRQQQLAAFQSAAIARYHFRLLDHYRKTIPEHAGKYDDDALLRIVAETHQRAQTYGLQTAEGLCQFIGLAIIIGEGFDDEPNTGAFLAAPELDPDVKVKMLCDAVTAKLRQAGEGRT
jgi:hypothetical protein